MATGGDTATIEDVDAYRYWRAKVRGEDGEMLPTLGGERANGEEPQPGIWRVRRAKGAPLVPLHIWLVDDQNTTRHRWRPGLRVAGSVDGKPIGHDQLLRAWMYRFDHASKEDAKYYKENGVWPGELKIAPARPAGVGDNSSATAGAEPGVMGEIAVAIETAKAFAVSRKTLASKVDADMASNAKEKVNALRLKVKRLHDQEKAPHLRAGRAVDEKYNPIIDAAKTVTDTLRRLLEGWERDERARLEKERAALMERQRREAAAERDRLAKAQADLLAANPVAALTSPPVELPPAEPPPPPPIKIQAGGQQGKKTGFKDRAVYSIEDYAALLQAVCDHDDVREAAFRVAKARAVAGIAVPGLKISTERVAV